jgi:hypothetical protein
LDDLVVLYDPSGLLLPETTQSIRRQCILCCCLQELQADQQQAPAPFDSQIVGIDFTVPVEAGYILLINDSTTPILFRVHDSPNNLHVISESRSTTQGQSCSTSGRDSASIHMSVGSTVSGRADGSWQRSQQNAHNQSANMHIQYKERKQQPPQVFQVPAASSGKPSSILVNLTTYTMDVSVDAWFMKAAKHGMQQRTTVQLIQGRVMKAGQALRVGRDAPAASSWCEDATSALVASPAPSSTTANGSSSGGASATDNMHVKGGTPAMGFQC